MWSEFITDSVISLINGFIQQTYFWALVFVSGSMLGPTVTH